MPSKKRKPKPFRAASAVKAAARVAIGSRTCQQEADL
jgi:hypothetical protein